MLIVSVKEVVMVVRGCGDVCFACQSFVARNEKKTAAGKRENVEGDRWDGVVVVVFWGGGV